MGQTGRVGSSEFVPFENQTVHGIQALVDSQRTQWRDVIDWWIRCSGAHCTGWTPLTQRTETKRNRDIWRYCKTIRWEWTDLHYYVPKLRVFHSGAIGFLGVKLRSLSCPACVWPGMTSSRTRQGTAQQQVVGRGHLGCHHAEPTPLALLVYLVSPMWPGVGAMTEVKVSDRPMTMQGASRAMTCPSSRNALECTCNYVLR